MSQGTYYRLPDDATPAQRAAIEELIELAGQRLEEHRDEVILTGAHPLADVRETVRPLDRLPGAPQMRSLLAPNRLMIWAQTDCACIGVGANWVAPEDVETVCAMLRSQREWLMARRAEARAAAGAEEN